MTRSRSLAWPSPSRRVAHLLPVLGFFSALLGCDAGGVDVPHDMGAPDAIVVLDATVVRDPCLPWITTARYRVTTLHVPTVDEAIGGALTGHNVDGAGTTCSVPDYPGDVDNALVDLSDYLLTLPAEERIDLQAELDALLACPADASDCGRLDLVFELRSSARCDVVRVLDGVDAGARVLGVHELFSWDGERFRIAQYQLDLPSVRTAAGPVSNDLTLTNAVITGQVSESQITNLVFSGTFPHQAFGNALAELLAAVGIDLAFDELFPVLTNLYDVRIGGSCAALSVGLTGTATRLEEP